MYASTRGSVFIARKLPQVSPFLGEFRRKGLSRAPARCSIAALMPVEFALRPRIRLREDPAPPRPARARLPKFALPALAYWLAIGGFVYEFVQRHETSSPPTRTEAALALPPAEAPVDRKWWRPLPAPAAPPPASAPLVEPPAIEPEPELAQASPAALPPAELSAPASSESPAPAPAELPAPPRSSLRSADRPRAPAPPPEAPHLRAPSRAPRTSAIAQTEPDPTPSLAPLPAVAPVFERPPTPAPAPDAPRAVASGLPSCEAALASASQDMDFSGNGRVADLPTQAIAAVLENGAWLSSCGLPEHTTLDVCVAIKGGRVVGASVTSRPADATLNACVKRRASSLQFPYSPHLDVARTRF